MAELSVTRLAKDMDFDILSDGGKKKIEVPCVDVNRPGLFLTGFHEHFDVNRWQVLGNAEQAYLGSLSEEERKKAINDLLDMPFPFMVLSHGIDFIPGIVETAKEKGVVLYQSRQNRATKVVAEMTAYLNSKLAPMQTVHGVLLDIYGLGILLTGDSGIGKSETALELVKRGHRLVADDAVVIKRISERRLIGESPEPIRHMMELRGIGIINVELMYGISAVIDTKSVDLIVHLEFWDKNKDYDRLGMEQDRQEILGVPVPLLTIPVHPGRNLAIILESAARTTRLRQTGYNALDEIKERQIKMMEE